jgi:hypothetical protein
LTFIPDNSGRQLCAGSNNTRAGKIVNGRWILDEEFNGKRKTKPNVLFTLLQEQEDRVI